MSLEECEYNLLLARDDIQSISHILESKTIQHDKLLKSIQHLCPHQTILRLLLAYNSTRYYLYSSKLHRCKIFLAVEHY